MTVELTKQELEVLVNLIGQVRVQPMAPGSVEAMVLYNNLGKKLVDALQVRDGSNGQPIEPQIDVNEYVK